MGLVVNGKAGHGLGPTRARVLRHLLGIDGGISVQAMADALELHNNTARFHLEALVDSGYARRELEAPQGQGRPRALYHSTEQAPVVETDHLRDLTQVLVRQLILRAPEPEQVAEDVGRSWGEEVSRATTAQDGPVPEGDRDEGMRRLLDHTTDMGFSVNRPDDQTITFHSCPYRAVSQPALASICRVHFGMMRGYLESTGSDLDVTSLKPGEVCVATLHLRSSDGDPGTGVAPPEAGPGN